MDNIGNYYLINHLVLLTGLTDRTIRSYLSAGILHGEKINGIWHFTPEQVDDFIRHPAVRPSILAKHHAVVYDFLSNTHQGESEVCMIMDLPGGNKKGIAEYFCYAISSESLDNIQFRFDGASDVPRVILEGSMAEVLRLVNGYRSIHE